MNVRSREREVADVFRTVVTIGIVVGVAIGIVVGCRDVRITIRIAITDHGCSSRRDRSGQERSRNIPWNNCRYTQPYG